MLSIRPTTTARVLACALALAMLEMAHGQSAPAAGLEDRA